MFPDPYTSVIQWFFYESVSSADTPAEVRFEAISAAVVGTKQRRFGPVPKPEVLVAVRERLHDETIHLFLPWGSRKQADGAPLDVAEFCALKQLHCLQEELRRYGKKCAFTFRLEDLTDRFLFSDGDPAQSDAYVREFRAGPADARPGRPVARVPAGRLGDIPVDRVPVRAGVPPLPPRRRAPRSARRPRLAGGDPSGATGVLRGGVPPALPRPRRWPVSGSARPRRRPCRIC